MYLVEQTSTRLKLQIQDKYLGFLLTLFSSLFFVPGFVAILYSELTILKCNRLEPSQVRCELISSKLLEKHITPIPTGQLQGAEVEKGERSNGGVSYRVVLLTKNGKIPLIDADAYDTDDTDQEKILKKANKINTFVSDQKQMSLIIQHDPRWFLYPVGGIFVFFSGSTVYSFLTVKIQTSCIFDTSSHRMYLKRQNTFSSEVVEHSLDEIKEAQVLEKSDSDGDKTYSTKLILHSGEEIPLSLTGSGTEHHKIAQLINQFLNTKS